ncbi:MAG: 3-keto-disaccharide hydrolase [Planctomycetota bacterium]|jgi:hypothetical protein
MPRRHPATIASAFLACLVAGCAATDSVNAPPRGRALFDGETLDGWHAIGGGAWSVKDGAIVGTSSASTAAHGLLVTDEVFTDFVVEFEYLVRAGDSGFYFRVEEVAGAVGVHGFQVEVDDVEPGGLYETGGRAWVVKHAPEAASEWHKSGEWNHVRLSAIGGDVRVHVNGSPTAMLDDDPGRRAGHLALQLHGGQDMDVAFREIRIVESGE